MRGARAPHCAPGRYTYSAVVYASWFPYAMHIPSGCDGNRTRAIPGLQNPGLLPISTHPTILFWLGNRRPRDGRTDVLLLASASGSRGARPEPPINAGVTTRALCTQGISHGLHRCCRRAGRTSPKLARALCNQGNFPCPGTGYRRFFSPPLRPI